jgi:type VI protein secretion system component VasK
VKPNLAFGPIDSVTQYLLYLSVVVLGVLLPLLLQRWRNQREQARLLARTVASITAELSANRRRVIASRETLAHLRATLEIYREHRLALRRHLVQPGDPALLPAAPDDSQYGISVPLLTRTAWEVASHAQALTLLPEARLSAFTRAYQVQEMFAADRSSLTAMLMDIEQLELPADMNRTETLDAQLRVLTSGLATARYHVGLADAMLEAYDAALVPQTTPTPSTT